MDYDIILRISAIEEGTVIRRGNNTGIGNRYYVGNPWLKYSNIHSYLVLLILHWKCKQIREIVHMWALTSHLVPIHLYLTKHLSRLVWWIDFVGCGQSDVDENTRSWARPPPVNTHVSGLTIRTRGLRWRGLKFWVLWKYHTFRKGIASKFLILQANLTPSILTLIFPQIPISNPIRACQSFLTQCRSKLPKFNISIPNTSPESWNQNPRSQISKFKISISNSEVKISIPYPNSKVQTSNHRSGVSIPILISNFPIGSIRIQIPNPSVQNELIRSQNLYRKFNFSFLTCLTTWWMEPLSGVKNVAAPRFQRQNRGKFALRLFIHHFVIDRDPKISTWFDYF